MRCDQMPRQPGSGEFPARAEHTRGPWVVVEQPGGSTQIQQSELDGATICEFPYGVETPVERANAALITAAPDMVLALLFAEVWLAEARKHLNGFASCDNTLRVVRAAIAKARP